MSEHRSFNIPDPRESTKSPLKRRNYLLAIGIDNYEHVGKLSNAVRDAQQVIHTLTDHYQFDPDQVYTLFNEAATEDGIIAIFKKIRPQLRPTDNLLIYFSGHGHYEADIDEGYWVPVDARYGRTNDYISYSFLLKVIKSFEVHHLMLLVDSCYSGAIFVSERSMGAGRTDFSRLDKDPSRWVMASGRNEVVPDGVSGGNSPFARELIDTLGRYKNEGIRMSTLVNKVVTATIHNSVQTPLGRPIFGVGDKGGEFIFYPKGAAGAIPPVEKPITQQRVDSYDPPKPPGTEETSPSRRSILPWAVAGALLVGLVVVWMASGSGTQKARNIEPGRIEAVEVEEQPEREVLTPTDKVAGELEGVKEQTPGRVEVEKQPETERQPGREVLVPTEETRRKIITSTHGKDLVEKVVSYRPQMDAKQRIEFHELERLNKTATSSLVTMAEKGDSWAECRLGMEYLIKEDFKQAVEWFSRSAKQDNSYGQLFLSLMYKEGLGVKKDLVTARKLLIMSAERGNPVAAQFLKEMGE